MIDLSGKVVLVTGGTRGIGAAASRAIVAAGGAVVAHYGANDAKAEALAKDLGQDRCHLIKADLSRPGVARSIWAAALDWRGRVDVLVNNAGIFAGENRTGPDEDWQAVWQRTLQVNLIAAGDLCREAVNHWTSLPSGGAIVNVASRAAFRGDDQDHWAYAASKGGLVSLTKTLARAYGAQGIHAYGIAPGFVVTDMVQTEFDEDPGLAQRVLRDVPLGAFAPVEEIANAICFFAAGMATHATGQTLDINGASYVR
jgi:NAD(P)-dependent dehydrogenase (short-subunit alcohol dehydrogenase family)